VRFLVTYVGHEVGARHFRASEEIPAALHCAAETGVGLMLQADTVLRDPYGYDGAWEFVGKVPQASMEATLRVTAAAGAAGRWSAEVGAPVGVRVWTVVGGGLRPAFMRENCWSASVAIARCPLDVVNPPRDAHPAPGADCHCGLYAARPDSPQNVPVDRRWYVAGVVALYGRVIPYAGGWRAERARILELWAPPGSVDPSRYPGVTIHEL
jgi:hypothetical protein